MKGTDEIRALWHWYKDNTTVDLNACTGFNLVRTVS